MKVPSIIKLVSRYMPVSRQEYEEKNASAAYWMRECYEAQSLLMHEREEMARQLALHIEATNKAVRERDEAKQEMYVTRTHTAAITRAMGKVRTAVAQVLENADELKHWLAKHGSEIDADLDTDMILDPREHDLGSHSG